MFAIFLGVTGLGVLSQLTNFITLLNYFVPLGIPNGLSKFVSEKNISEKEALNNIFSSSISLVFYPTIIFSILLFLFSDQISNFLFQSEEYGMYVKIISLCIPFIVLNSIFEGLIRGLVIINTYSRLIIISNIINLILLIPLIIFFKMTGALLGVLTSYIIYVFCSIFFLRRSNILGKFKFSLSFDRELFIKLLKVSFALLLSGALFQFSILLLRKIIINDFGIYYNGIFQSVIGISLSYFSFIFLALSTYSFPTISKIYSNNELVNELNVNLRFIIIIMVPLVMMLFTLRYFIISLLFTKEFVASQSLFSFQFLGDFFKALAWSIGIWLVPRMKLRAFLILEIILNVNLIMIFYILISIFDRSIEFVSISYLSAYIIHFLLNYFVSRKYVQFRFSSQNVKLLLISLIFLIPAILVSNYYYNVGIFLLFPVIGLWIYFSISKEEFSELYSFILQKLKIAR